MFGWYRDISPVDHPDTQRSFNVETSGSLICTAAENENPAIIHCGIVEPHNCSDHSAAVQRKILPKHGSSPLQNPDHPRA